MSTVIECTNEADWLGKRRVGASDAPVILGVSPFNTRFPLYAEKVGDVEPEDLSEIERIKWGHRLQRPIGDAYAEETGRIVRHWEPFTIATHIEHDWMTCTPDAQQDDRERGHPGALEIKAVNAFAKRDWENEPPLYYQVQLQHQLAVLNAKWGTLCVLIGGQEMRWFDVERNDAFIEALIEEEGRFWDRVMRRDPPPIDGSVATSKALQRLHPQDSGETITLSEDAEAWDGRLRYLKAVAGSINAETITLENKFKAALGDATCGLLPNGGQYSWRTQQRKAYSVKASSSRVLRRLK